MLKKIGSVNNKTFVYGNANELKPNQVLVSKDQGYVILLERVCGKLKTYVVIPIEEFIKEEDSLEN